MHLKLSLSGLCAMASKLLGDPETLAKYTSLSIEGIEYDDEYDARNRVTKDGDGSEGENNSGGNGDGSKDVDSSNDTEGSESASATDSGTGSESQGGEDEDESEHDSRKVDTMVDDSELKSKVETPEDVENDSGKKWWKGEEDLEFLSQCKTLAKILRAMAKLKSLRRFQMIWDGDADYMRVPTKVWDAIADNSSTLESLIIERSNGESENWGKMVTAEYPNLHTLEFDFCQGGHGWDLSPVDKMITRLAPQLKHLAFRFPSCDLDSCIPYRYHLNATFPSLEHIGFSTVNTSVVRNFLTHNPHIVSLVLESGEERHSDVEFASPLLSSGKMTFPSLKALSFGGYKYDGFLYPMGKASTTLVQVRMNSRDYNDKVPYPPTVYPPILSITYFCIGYTTTSLITRLQAWLQKLPNLIELHIIVKSGFRSLPINKHSAVKIMSILTDTKVTALTFECQDSIPLQNIPEADPLSIAQIPAQLKYVRFMTYGEHDHIYRLERSPEVPIRLVELEPLPEKLQQRRFGPNTTSLDWRNLSIYDHLHKDYEI